MIQKIGSRLVRSFGEGANLKTIVTETIGEGKTLTKVLNSEGRVLQERLKAITRDQEVGDKWVNTVTKVTQEGSTVKKTVTDHVYKLFEGIKKLGERIRTFNLDGITRKEIKVDGKRLRADFEDGTRSYMYKDAGNYSGSINCNDKGLPVPWVKSYTGHFNSMEGCNGKTMKELRTELQQKYPHQSYAPEAFSFSAPANERVEGTVLTDLEQYL